MKVKQYTVNEAGMQEIRQFLAEHHKRGRDYFSNDEIFAWAADAEFQLGEGNPACIEIRAWDSTSGHTEEYTISDAGLDVEMVEID